MWSNQRGNALMLGLSLALVLLFAFPATAGVGTGSYSFTFSSPDHLQELSSRRLHRQIRAERDEHKASGQDEEDFEFSGWKKDSPLRKDAEAIGAKTGLLNPSRTNSLVTAITGLPSDLESGHLLLAAPGDAASSSSGAGGALMSFTASGGQLSVQDQKWALQQVTALKDEVANGAIVNTGALPRDSGSWDALALKSENSRFDNLRHSEIEWLLALDAAEEENLEIQESPERLAELAAAARNASEAMLEWFEQRGGKMVFTKPVEEAPDITPGKDDPPPPPALVAEEQIRDGDVVLSMPLKVALCKLSARHIKGPRGGKLSDALKDVFEKKEEWGLTMLVLYEYFKHKSFLNPPPKDVFHSSQRRQRKQLGLDKGSQWGPFLNTLRISAPGYAVLQELQGTSAMDVMKLWTDEAKELQEFLRKKHICFGGGGDVCTRQPGKLGGAGYTLNDLRWGLWVVRQMAVRVFKRSTQEPFLALVPYMNLLRHSSGAGGSVTFEFDNTIQVAVGSHTSGSVISIDKGPYTDAESFLLSSHVDEGMDLHSTSTPGLHAAIRVMLPVQPTSDNNDDLFWQIDTLRKWRRSMNLPPRLTDLWRLTEQLHLFGDGEEEQRLLSGANTRIAGLPLPTDQATPEEQLMLVNGISENDAQLAIFGDDKFTDWKPQLYTAPDPEDDPTVEDVMEELADSVAQLSDSVAASHVDNSTQAVINATRNFLVHGIMPSRGLDKVDQLLLRKLSLLRKCGEAPEYLFLVSNVSTALRCAMRVHLLNETDLELVCPRAEGPWHKPDCADSDFSPSLPISPSNEEATLRSLLQMVSALKAHYPSTVDDDRRLLQSPHFPARGSGSPVRSAAVVRLRELVLLDTVQDFLLEEVDMLGSMNYSTTQAVKDAEERAVASAEEAAWRERVLAEAAVRQVISNVSVEVTAPPDGATPGGVQQAFLVVREGESLEDRLYEFCTKYGIGQAGMDSLRQAALAKTPTVPPLLLAMPVIIPTGIRRVLTIHEGENATLAARGFCLIHNITGSEEQNVVSVATARAESRMKRELRLSVPVDSLDGRQLTLRVREGEQHDLYAVAGDFVDAYRLPAGFAAALAREAEARLPITILYVPVSSSGRRTIQLRIAPGDEAKLASVIDGFCEVFDLPESNKPNLRQAILSGLHPDAHVTRQRMSDTKA